MDIFHLFWWQRLHIRYEGLSLFHLTRSFGAVCLRYRPTLLLWHNRTGLSVTALLSLNILHRHLEFFSDLNIKIYFWNILKKNSKWSIPHTSPSEHLHRWTAGLAYTPSSAPENIIVEETIGFKIGKMSTEVWTVLMITCLHSCLGTLLHCWRGTCNATTFKWQTDGQPDRLETDPNYIKIMWPVCRLVWARFGKILWG